MARALLLPCLLPLSGALAPCGLSVVGAGWGGVYAAWRLAVDAANAGGLAPRDVCVFEAYDRPGGRTFDIDLDGFVVDVGAYRFAGDMHLPADLIGEALRLPSVCYAPSCSDADVHREVSWPYLLPLRKIVDFRNRSLGYGAAISAMLDELSASGVRLHFGRELVSLRQQGARWRLEFASGEAAVSSSVILNLPRAALRNVGGLSEAMGRRWPALECQDRAFPQGVTEGRATVKAYALYEEAWWVSRLGLLEGAAEALQSDPPLALHYHDGEVLCADGLAPGGGQRWRPARDATNRTHCRGVLQAFYRHSQLCPAANPGCMDYWAKLPRESPALPLTVLRGETALAKAVHEKLMEMHGPAFRQKNASMQDIEPPRAVAFSVWARQDVLPPGDRGLLASVADVIFEGERLPNSCGGDGSVETWREMVQGTGSWAREGAGLHVANNDFSAGSQKAWHGPWAEMSLLGAERVLRGAFGLARPAWLNASYYQREVLGSAQGQRLMV